MPANRPNRETVLQREITAWKLRCRGWTTQRIAEELGLTRQGVEAILKRVETRESKALSKSFARVKAKQYHQLEHIYEETLDAWHKSKEALRRARQTNAGDGEEGQIVTEVIDREGNVTYLHTAMKAAAEQRSLYGLDVQAAPQDQAAGIAQLNQDLEERGREYEAREEEERASRDSSGVPPASEGRAPEVQAGPGTVQ